MATYERSTRVDAPLEDVWAFYSRVDGLVELMPEWFDLRVESVRGPDGEADPGVLEVGATVHASVRPFGVGPRQDWASEIVARDEGEDHAVFRDVMREGVFPHWEHTHRFVANGDGTDVHDKIVYELPGGPLGRAVGPLGVLGFEPMFRHRHRRTREILETR